jgi:hypothetical protein
LIETGDGIGGDGPVIIPPDGAAPTAPPSIDLPESSETPNGKSD